MAREGWQGWDEYAPFYDWENAQTVRRRDVRFWQRLAAAADGRVLELGCGTGRITIPVARNGTPVTGIDRSAPMIDRARAKRVRRRDMARIDFVRGDIRRLPVRTRQFGLVMAPYGILQSLVRERDLADALASVARVLKPGGRFGIDLVPDLPEWSEYRGRKTLSGTLSRGVPLIEDGQLSPPILADRFDQRHPDTTRECA